jgi:hypothetical protein
VRDMGLGEYEQRYWISRDDYGATFIQASCGALSMSLVMPTPKTQAPTEKSSQRSRQENTRHLMTIIKHNEGARSQL